VSHQWTSTLNHCSLPWTFKPLTAVQIFKPETVIFTGNRTVVMEASIVVVDIVAKYGKYSVHIWANHSKP
jgi:hypothetical protein